MHYKFKKTRLLPGGHATIQALYNQPSPRRTKTTKDYSINIKVEINNDVIKFKQVIEVIAMELCKLYEYRCGVWTDDVVEE